jgi:diadenosine tetraphosphatase ApaH/serine/threonine PP2A family protein phosphatase
MNEKYGFHAQCMRHLGEDLGSKCFDLIGQAFNQLPLACLVDDSILVLHGGIGNGKWSLDDLHDVQRPLTEDMISAPAQNWIFNMLWSDPIEEDDRHKKTSSEIFGVHTSPRTSHALQFGWNVTETFCAQNGLQLIVRSHQCKVHGHGFDVMHNDMLVRVFSARDYERHGNDAAILKVAYEQKGCLRVTPQVLRSRTKTGKTD